MFRFSTTVMLVCLLSLAAGCSDDGSAVQGGLDAGESDTVVVDTANPTDVDDAAVDRRATTDTAVRDTADTAGGDVATDVGDTTADVSEDDVSDGAGGADASCTDNCTRPLPQCSIDDVQRSPGNNWGDSYSVDDKCYCDSTFDHDIGSVMVDTPDGQKTVREVCDAIGPGPGAESHPVYNDIQCGNGPPNDAGDEDWCPGRVDQGKSGCCTAGPTWDLSNVQW